MPRDTVDLPRLERPAFFRADSFDEQARTVDLIWTTGQRRRVRSFFGDFEEELSLDPGAVRLDALNSGAPFLNSHMRRLDMILGAVVEGSARIEDGRGIATVRFSERAEVAPIMADIRAGIIRNVSVGYRVHRFQITERADERDLWRAVDWEPVEISAVAVGADTGAKFRSEDEPPAVYPCALVRAGDPATDAARAADGKEGTMPEQNRDAAADQSVQTETRAAAENETRTAPRPAPEQQAEGAGAAAQAAAQAPAEGQRSEPAGAAQAEASSAATEAVRAERDRMSGIMALCERHGMTGEFQRDLIQRGVSLDAARAAILDHLAEQDAPAGRRMEPAPAAARGEGSREIAFRDAVSEALMHRYDPSAEIGEGAREFRGLTLVEIAREALGRRNVDTRGMSRMEVAAEALGMRSAGYHSTSDFSSILANVANKTLRRGYERTPRTFTAWARQTTISDFKPVSRVQLSGAPDLEKVLESGEFQYGTMSEGKETIQLVTYGKIVGVTRQVIINDDLDAFTRIPAAFGAAAADLEADIVYAILTQNPAMGDGKALFHADHGNLGTGAVIGETALAEAYRLFGKQKGLEKRLIRVTPRYIIVPPGTRSVEARKHVANTTPSSTSDVNAFAGRLEVIEEPRLIPASGQDPWFMAADPARVDTVEFGYLDGQAGVYTETRTGFNVDGVEIKARHDFAAKAIDWRGLYKNAGAAASG